MLLTAYSKKQANNEFAYYCVLLLN